MASQFLLADRAEHFITNVTQLARQKRPLDAREEVETGGDQRRYHASIARARDTTVWKSAPLFIARSQSAWKTVDRG